MLKIPDNWMTQLLHEHSDIRIRVFNCIPYKSGGRGLMVLSSNKKLDVILENVKRSQDVVRTSFSRISEYSAIGKVVLSRCAACMALKQSDCFTVSSRSMSNGWIEWSVVAENNRTIFDLIDLLERYGCGVQLTQISSSCSLSLTQRQKEILQFAYSNGYYEYPRRITLRELSCIFNVSSSTLSEILRAGERRVFMEYFRTFSG